MDKETLFLANLVDYCPPPKAPRFGEQPASWDNLRQKYGPWLPSFLSTFGRTYGTGQFQTDTDNYVRIYNPHDPAYPTSIAELSSIFADVYAESPEFPYKCYPSEGGLFPIGHARGGESLYVLRLPTEQTICFVHDERSSMHDPSGFHRISGIGFFEFLYRFLRNEIQGYEYFEGKPLFVPGWGY